MIELFGLQALPGQLPKLLEPWARALIDASVPTRNWVREATEIGAAMIADWVVLTPEIEAARCAARVASARLADRLDDYDETGAPPAKIQAQDAFRRLVTALHHARPAEGKNALGLGW